MCILLMLPLFYGGWPLTEITGVDIVHDGAIVARRLRIADLHFKTAVVSGIKTDSLIQR